MGTTSSKNVPIGKYSSLQPVPTQSTQPRTISGNVDQSLSTVPQKSSSANLQSGRFTGIKPPLPTSATVLNADENMIHRNHVLSELSRRSISQHPGANPFGPSAGAGGPSGFQIQSFLD